MISLTQSRLKELIEYNSETGIFLWRVRRYGGPLAGSCAGTLHKDGYRCITIDGHAYLASRLAWFYIIGRWPQHQIDHRDLNKDNNSFDNLREATPEQNCANRPRRRDSAQPYKGVSKKGSKWRATIRIGGKREYLGYFDTAEEAHEAYAKRLINAHNNFARAA